MRWTPKHQPANSTSSTYCFARYHVVRALIHAYTYECIAYSSWPEFFETKVRNFLLCLCQRYRYRNEEEYHNNRARFLHGELHSSYRYRPLRHSSCAFSEQQCTEQPTVAIAIATHPYAAIVGACVCAFAV